MIHWKLGVGLCATLASVVAVLPATAQGLNSQQTTLFEHTAASICNTVKETKGQKSEEQIQGEVNANLGGFVGRIVNTGGSVKGSVSREEFDGLSQDATAAAQEGDRGCRERVFIRMFDKLTAGAPPPNKGLTCAVNDPTPTPLNVRASPNGLKKGVLYNGDQVTPLRFASAANGKSWAYVSNPEGQSIGWVFFPYLACR
jgi:hypothetical protein